MEPSARNLTTFNPPPDYYYIASEILVGILSVLGNALVVCVFCVNKRIRIYCNFYIVALAIADFLVGLIGIPLAILASVGLPRNLYGCLFSLSIIIVLCFISICCLVSVSIDRFWAVFSPLSYYKNMSSNVVYGILAGCFILGAFLGLLPLLGWYNEKGWKGEGSLCDFREIIDFNYLAFIYFTINVVPALLMIGFYAYIYRFLQQRRSKKRRLGQSTELETPPKVEDPSEKAQRKEARTGQKLSSIVFFFFLCWFPLNTLNCIKAFYNEFEPPFILIQSAVVLSHANSAINPFLYAYHLKEMGIAMKKSLSSLLAVVSFGLSKRRVSQPIVTSA